MKNNIVITGGGSGIGKEIALNLSKKFNVIICGRKLSKLKAVASKSENIFYYKCDVSKEIEVKKLKKFVSKKFGYLDILINNASILGEIGPYYQTNSKKWENTFKNNFLSTYICCKIFLDLIKKSKIKKIINVTGGGAFDNFPNFSAYAVSKAAIVRFTETIAQELIKMKIKVYGISPGFVITPIQNKIFTTGINKVGKRHYKFVKSKLNKDSIPINLVAECINFLISQKSNGLTGKTISVGFDDWQKKDFPKLIKLISSSNLFSLRRINPINLDKKSKLYIELKKLQM